MLLTNSAIANLLPLGLSHQLPIKITKLFIIVVVRLLVFLPHFFEFLASFGSEKGVEPCCRKSLGCYIAYLAFRLDKEWEKCKR